MPSPSKSLTKSALAGAGAKHQRAAVAYEKMNSSVRVKGFGASDSEACDTGGFDGAWSEKAAALARLFRSSIWFNKKKTPALLPLSASGTFTGTTWVFLG